MNALIKITFFALVLIVSCEAKGKGWFLAQNGAEDSCDSEANEVMSGRITVCDDQELGTEMCVCREKNGEFKVQCGACNVAFVPTRGDKGANKGNKESKHGNKADREAKKAEREARKAKKAAKQEE